jgi:anti-anti-sigma factor
LVPTLDDVRVERPAPGKGVVVFSGEHDLATRSEVRDLLGSLVVSDELIVADFSSAEFVDSAILGVLLDTHKRALEQGKSFRLPTEHSRNRPSRLRNLRAVRGDGAREHA